MNVSLGLQQLGQRRAMNAPVAPTTPSSCLQRAWFVSSHRSWKGSRRQSAARRLAPDRHPFSRTQPLMTAPAQPRIGAQAAFQGTAQGSRRAVRLVRRWSFATPRVDRPVARVGTASRVMRRICPARASCRQICHNLGRSDRLQHHRRPRSRARFGPPAIPELGRLE